MRASLIVQLVKNLPATQETSVQFLGQEDPLEKDRLPTPVFLGFPVAQLVKNLHIMWETYVRSLGWEDLLEKGKATHSSILAWRIPWTCIVHGVAKSWTRLSHVHFSGNILGGSVHRQLEKLENLQKCFDNLCTWRNIKYVLSDSLWYNQTSSILYRLEGWGRARIASQFLGKKGLVTIPIFPFIVYLSIKSVLFRLSLLLDHIFPPLFLLPIKYFFNLFEHTCVYNNTVLHVSRY